MVRSSNRSEVAKESRQKRWQMYNIQMASTSKQGEVGLQKCPSQNVSPQSTDENVKQGGSFCVPEVSYADVVTRDAVCVASVSQGHVKHRAQSRIAVPHVSDDASLTGSPHLQQINQRPRKSFVNVGNQPSETHVRASRSQAHPKYGKSRNSQCTCNSLTFLAFLQEDENITRADLNCVLDKGDVMYNEARKRFPNRVHLAFDELPDIVIARRCKYYVDMTKPSRYGTYGEPSKEAVNTYLVLQAGLSCLLSDVQYALLVMNSLCIAVFRSQSGTYGFFDPHSRRANGLPMTPKSHNCGKAVMLMFTRLSDMINRLYNAYDKMKIPVNCQYELKPLQFYTLSPVNLSDAVLYRNCTPTVNTTAGPALLDEAAEGSNPSTQKRIEQNHIPESISPALNNEHTDANQQDITSIDVTFASSIRPEVILPESKTIPEPSDQFIYPQPYDDSHRESISHKLKKYSKDRRRKMKKRLMALEETQRRKDSCQRHKKTQQLKDRYHKDAEFRQNKPAVKAFVQQCSNCDSTSAACWCLDCNEALCSVCVLAHRRVTVTRSHRLLHHPPEGIILTSPTKFCGLHPSEPLKLICFTCKQLTCRDCQLMSHMNHRYQFVSETVVSLKKQLDVYAHSIKQQEDTVRQSLQDMGTRLKLIEQTESHLRTLLQEGFITLAKLLKANMMTLHQDMQKVYELDCEQIRRRMVKLKLLQQRQSSMKENLERARSLPDLRSLLAHTVQIKSEMKALLDQDPNPPLRMPEVKLITKTDCQETFSELCKLHVSWVPFSVPPTSDKNAETPAISPPTSTCNPISSTVMDSTSGSTSLNPVLTSSSALCSLAASKSRRDSTSPNSTSTCPVSFSSQTETAICNASPVSSHCVATPSPSPSSNSFSFNKFSSNLTLYNLLTQEHVETHHPVNPLSPSTNSQSGQLTHALPPTSTSSTPSRGPLLPSCSSSGTPASRSSPLCTPSPQHFPMPRSSFSSSSFKSISSPAHTATLPLPSDPITQTGKTWNCNTPIASHAVPSQSKSLSDWSSILPSSTTSRLPHPSGITHSISTHPAPTGPIKTGTTSDIPTPVTITSFSSKSACLSSQLSLPLSSTSCAPSPSGPVITGSIAQTGTSSDISTPVTINSLSSPSAHLTNQLSLPPPSVSSISPYSSLSTTLSTSTCPAASTRPLFQTLNTSVTNMVVPDGSKSHPSVLLVSCNQSNLPLSSSICPSSVAPPTISSTCLAPFTKPLPQTSDTRTAGAPVQMNSFSTSLPASSNQFKPLLTHSAVVLACSTTTSSTTPPKFISTCTVSSCTPFPQAGNSNNTNLLVPVNTFSSTSKPTTSFFVNYSTNPPVSTFSGLTNPASLVPVRFSSSLWNSSSTSSSIAFTHTTSATPLTSTSSAMTQSPLLHTAYSLVPVNHLSTSEIFTTTASGNNRSSPPYWFLPQTGASRASIVQCLSMLPRGSTFPLSASQSLPTLQPVQPLQVLNQTVGPHQNQPTIVMLTNTQSTYQVLLNETAVFKVPDNHASHLAIMQKQSGQMESTITQMSPDTSNSADGLSSTLPSNQQTPEDKSPALLSSPLSSLQKLDSDSALYSSSSSSCERNQQIPTVDCVVDSRCDNSMQHIEKAQENNENKHNTVISEETNVTPFLSEETELEDNLAALETSESEEVSAAIGQQDFSLSQWQPKVSVFRLPLSLPSAGHPLPSFRLLPGETEDEIYLEEMSEDSQSDADDVPSDKEDFRKPLSSPDSPVTLEILSCSVCASPGTSIICSACGRGYHRDCHIPPVGPDFWSEWICSLCQDLSDPSDPYSAERLQSTSLSLQNQRRCESLVLYLKVEVCSQCSEFGGLSRLKLISDRLTLRRPPPYETATQLVSDMWALFEDASQDDELNKLQESFQKKLVETLSSVLHPSLLTSPTPNPQPADGSHHSREEESESSKAEEEAEVIPASKLKNFRKRLRDFLHLNSSPVAKRAKREDQ